MLRNNPDERLINKTTKKEKTEEEIEEKIEEKTEEKGKKIKIHEGRFIEAAKTGDIETIRRTFPIIKHNNYNLTNGLKLAARFGKLKVVKFLSNARVNIDSALDDGITPLMEAIKFGHYNVVHYLIEKGADIFAKDMYQRDPRFYAKWSNRMDIFGLLIIKTSAISSESYETMLHAHKRGKTMIFRKYESAEELEYLSLSKSGLFLDEKDNVIGRFKRDLK